MIYVVVDTNVLHISYDKDGENIYHSPEMNKNFYALQDLQSEKSIDKVSIIVPEMVLCELVEQNVASYINDVEKLNKLVIIWIYSICSTIGCSTVLTCASVDDAFVVEWDCTCR